jgi:hypothetical protein
MAAFAEHELKKVSLEDLKDAASTLEIAQYGKKADIASRIVSHKGGKGILKKLIATSLKAAQQKEATKGGGPKADFMKKERARLIESGVKDKKKMGVELKRLWTMYQATSKTSSKPKTSVGKSALSFVTSTKLLPDAVCKARNLTLVGSDSSSGKTVYKYKVNVKSSTKKVTVEGAKKRKRDADKDDEGDDDADDEDDEDDDDAFDKACVELEDRAVVRLKSKKIKREHINGILEGFGVDASAWTLAHAKEEVVVQMLNETDDEDSDDEEEEGDDEDDE